MRSEKLRKADVILIAALLLLSAVTWFAVRLSSTGGAFVTVTVDSREVGRYSLSEDGTYPLNGGTNILVISGGTACIADADCPDKLCVGQGRISLTGQTIVCLPNKLIVTVCGAGEPLVDAVS